MKPLNECIDEYREQMQKGVIKAAYKGLMEYMMGLRGYFEKKYPECYVSGNIYYGYMDMTYFSFIPEELKRRKLKVAIVFIHDTVRFEVWLGGYNRQVQGKYWKFFRESGWDKYRVPATIKGMDSIVEHVLAERPDFGDLDALTRQIERGTLQFIKDVSAFLEKNAKAL